MEIDQRVESHDLGMVKLLPDSSLVIRLFYLRPSRLVSTTKLGQKTAFEEDEKLD